VGTPIVFNGDDIADFAAASGDLNPLHVSAEYAHRTPYGQPVVHGVVVALAALAHMGPLEDRGLALSRFSAVFSAPVFCDAPYTLTTHSTHDSHTAVVSDGSTPLARVTGRFGRRGGSQDRLRDSGPRFGRRSAGDFDPGRAVETATSGDWFPAVTPLRSLLQRLGLSLPLDQAAALAWCSYLAGMDLPGRQALLHRVHVEFDPDPAEGDRFDYRASVERFDSRFNRLEVAGELTLGSRPYATVRLVALVRRARQPRGAADPALPVSHDLQGRTAVVVGASRGLGAATVEALARRGASVVGAYRQDHAAAEELRRGLGERASRVRMVSGDLTDSAAAAALLEEADNRPDILICCASPPFQPLRIEPDHVDRILGHIDEAIRLVAVSLAAFLPALARQSGRVVVISSSSVERPVATWPHYVAAKQGIEGLVRVASLQYPDVRFLVKRPPVLDTDLAASPIAVERPTPPETVADAIATWLADPPPDELLTIEEQYPHAG
jgi:NAD(P)-dependent dehydrogenase (short-subunit alcohol dehydrogenase family)